MAPAWLIPKLRGGDKTVSLLLAIGGAKSGFFFLVGVSRMPVTVTSIMDEPGDSVAGDKVAGFEVTLCSSSEGAVVLPLSVCWSGSADKVALLLLLLFSFWPQGRQLTRRPRLLADACRGAWAGGGDLRFGRLSRLSRRTMLPRLPSVFPLAMVGLATTALSSVSAETIPSGRSASWLGRSFSVWISRPPESDMMESCEAVRRRRGRGLPVYISSKLVFIGVVGAPLAELQPVSLGVVLDERRSGV